MRWSMRAEVALTRAGRWRCSSENRQAAVLQLFDGERVGGGGEEVRDHHARRRQGTTPAQMSSGLERLLSDFLPWECSRGSVN